MAITIQDIEVLFTAKVKILIFTSERKQTIFIAEEQPGQRCGR